MESLRREAHRLEADLEEKTQAYSRLSQRMNSDILYDTEDPSDGAQEQMLAGEIDQLLSALAECNERMGVYVGKEGRTADSAMLQRYREILFDFSTEFKKTSAALQRKREANELFRSSRYMPGWSWHELDRRTRQEKKPIATTTSSSPQRVRHAREEDLLEKSRTDGSVQTGGNAEQEHLLREQNAIHSSLISASGVLGQAAEAKESLRHQRASLMTASSTLSAMQTRFPAINRVVEGINKKKARDRLVVACVIAGCIIATLWMKGFL